MIKNVISDCACYGQDDKLIIYITDQSKILKINQYVAEKTSINRRAFVVKYISEIPKNSSGKTMYSKLSS